MRAEFTPRECGGYQTPPERTVRLGPYAVDAAPVSNAQFARFLQQSGYKPKHAENFLKHWVDGQPPPGREDHPVRACFQEARSRRLRRGRVWPSNL